MRLRLFAVLLLSMPSAWAGQQNAVRSCYSIAEMEQVSAPVSTAVFVLIDQTTALDANLQKLVYDNVQPLLLPGNAFSVARFSAYTRGYYTEILVSGSLDSLVGSDARDDISKSKLLPFDNCMKHQLPYVRKLVHDAVDQAFTGTSNELAKSDVLAGLKDISGAVKAVQAAHKIVLVVSDMLENSSVTSFYVNNAVRRLDVDKEIKLTTDAQLFGDFDGARIYVIGAGLLSQRADAKSAYRDPKTMQSLRDFWRQYFQQSKAELVEFGQPALLSPIRR